MNFPLGKRVLPGFLAICLLLSGCGGEENEKRRRRVPGGRGAISKDDDLAGIRKRGTLRALTRYNAISYFIYRGRPMGFDYELLTLLAEHLDLDLEIVVPDEWSALIPSLLEGTGDLIAVNMTITKKRAQKVKFVYPHILARQVLVQRKPDNWRTPPPRKMRNMMVRSPLDLIGRTITVRGASSYHARLENLGNELGEELDIELAPEDMETEDIIGDVAAGRIEYTVADENIARIGQSYYPDLDISVPVSFRQRMAWSVRKSSPELAEVVNEWMIGMIRTDDPTFNILYRRYFESPRSYRSRMRSQYFARPGGKISKFDELFKTVGEDTGLDWRLLAAIAAKESDFHARRVSWAGARGLMQVMPHVGQAYGVTDLLNPALNVRAAGEHLLWLEDYWEEKIPGRDERTKFILASYNVGQGHVLDATRLAEKYGFEGDVWDDNTAEYLLLKSKKQYFQDEVVRYGYCRGREPYEYVKAVISLYNNYLEFLPDADARKQGRSRTRHLSTPEAEQADPVS